MRAPVSSLHSFNASDDARYLTIGQVRQRFGVSASWVRRYILEHGFPKPVKFGGPKSPRHWIVADIEAWEAQRIRHGRAA